MRTLVILCLLFGAALQVTSKEPTGTFPTKYRVTTATEMKLFMAGHLCVMTVRDEANPGVLYSIKFKGHGCHVWDSGTVVNGRREKQEILIVEGDGTVERWEIQMTIDMGAPGRP